MACPHTKQLRTTGFGCKTLMSCKAADLLCPVVCFLSAGCRLARLTTACFNFVTLSGDFALCSTAVCKTKWLQYTLLPNHNHCCMKRCILEAMPSSVIDGRRQHEASCPSHSSCCSAWRNPLVPCGSQLGFMYLTVGVRLPVWNLQIVLAGSSAVRASASHIGQTAAANPLVLTNHTCCLAAPGSMLPYRTLFFSI